MIYSIITAAGCNVRFQSSESKLLTYINGVTVIDRVINTSVSANFKTYIGVSTLIDEYIDNPNVTKYIGGSTNANTIILGINKIFEENKISNDDLLVIFDGSRPGIDNELLDKELDLIKQFPQDMVCPRLQLNGIISSDGLYSIDRESIVAVQMPCVSNLIEVKMCYDKNTYVSPMDAWVNHNKKVRFVQGSLKYTKLTYLSDIDILNKLIA